MALEFWETRHSGISWCSYKMYNTGSSGSFRASSQPTQPMRGDLEYNPNDANILLRTTLRTPFTQFFSPVGSFFWKDVNHFLCSRAGVHYPAQSSQDFHSASLPLTQYVGQTTAGSMFWLKGHLECTSKLLASGLSFCRSVLCMAGLFLVSRWTWAIWNKCFNVCLCLPDRATQQLSANDALLSTFAWAGDSPRMGLFSLFPSFSP